MEMGLSIIWIQEDADGSICKTCEHVIKGTMYVLALKSWPPEQVARINKFCVRCKVKTGIE